MLIVKKFGGTSVGDKERIFNVARRCAEEYRKGNDIIVVLSAMGKSTDELIALAQTINPNPPKRELDMLLTTGEQVSTALMAMAFDTMDVPAVSLNAFQVAMHTTRVHGNARLKRIDTDRIMHELEHRRIVIVTGFQGVNKYDNYTTLGRGGSDTTAVALAAALHADACEIYTDVDGVYTTDPRVVSGAVKLEEITYDEMLELASQGAQVLHNRSVELAKKYRVNMEVVSSLEKKPGTKVKEVVKMEKTNIAGVAKDTSIARIAVVVLEHNPGVAFRVFSLLGRANINVDAIIQSIGRDTSKDISFTLPRADVEEATRVLEEQKDALGFDHLTVEDKIAKVSIVGAGMMTTPGVAAKMFEALYDANINIQMINTSEIRVSVLIDEENTTAAVRAVHDKFFGGEN